MPHFILLNNFYLFKNKHFNGYELKCQTMCELKQMSNSHVHIKYSQTASGGG